MVAKDMDRKVNLSILQQKFIRIHYRPRYRIEHMVTYSMFETPKF